MKYIPCKTLSLVKKRNLKILHIIPNLFGRVLGLKWPFLGSKTGVKWPKLHINHKSEYIMAL